MSDPERLEELTQQIKSRKKYRDIDAAIIQKIGAQELGRQKSFKDVEKAARSRLHQAACSYQTQSVNYESAIKKLARLPNSISSDASKAFCTEMMKTHASTRERLPILEQFYARIFAALPDIHSVIDCACGLNPLSLAWMPFHGRVRYDACDLFEKQAKFLQAFFDHFGVQGDSWTCDLTSQIPQGKYDLALILKTLPCLEQLEKSSGSRLLELLDAKYLLVTYPVASLGGYDKGMARNYTRQFEDITRNWHGEINRFEFETELAFLLTRSLE